MFIAEQKKAVDVTRELIERKVSIMRLDDVVTKELFINDWKKVFEVLGMNVEYDGHCPAHQVFLDEDEFEILEVSAEGGRHFVVGDGEGRTIYDPLGKRNDYAVITKRGFRWAK
jgi:hypothetical protein